MQQTTYADDTFRTIFSGTADVDAIDFDITPYK